MKRDYLFGEPRETVRNIVRLDDYRQVKEPETFRSIGEVAAKIIEGLKGVRSGKD